MHHHNATTMSSEIPAPVPVSNENIQDLICSICICLPSDVPVITPCQHIFCGDCLREALSLQQICPVDRCPVTPDQLTSLQEGSLTRRIWSNIRVKCGKLTDGCAWVGAIADYRNHLLSCEYNAQNSSSNHELREAKRYIEELLERNSRLNDKIDALDRAVQQKDDQLDQAVRESHRLKQNFSRLKEQVATLRNTIQQKDNRINEVVTDATNFDPRTTGIFIEDYSYGRFDVVKLSQLISSRLENKPYYIDSNKIFNCVQACFRDWNAGYTDNPKCYFLDMRMLLAICLASNWFTGNQSNKMIEWLSLF